MSAICAEASMARGEPKKGVSILGVHMRKPLEDYLVAVGQVAFHWNDLHEALGLVFVQLVGTSRKVGLGIWYATQSDRAQRDMLSAALRGREGDDPPWTPHARASADIGWVINEIKTHLAERRNNAIHAPAEMHLIVGEAEKKVLLSDAFEIGPSYYYGNPRATKLKGKALIEEFDWYSATALTLAQFTRDMTAALSTPDVPWPKRPRLPSLGQILDGAILR